MLKDGLTLGSLFDGSGGFPLGGLIAGIKPVWASEVEPFPIRVTTRRLPFMKHYGDISGLSGAVLEPVDIITFGSPCQDMSIAGKREGLDGKRSGLFYEAVRIVKEMRESTDGRYPRYIVWENVKGAFSSNKGEDFRCVLEEICGIREKDISLPRPEKWANAGNIVGEDCSVAWRLLDAVYWGVPQRRSRIYLVADLDGQSAGKILFESEGLSGYSAESFRAWQKATGSAREGSDKAGGICLNDQGGIRMDVTEGMTSALRAEAHHPPCVLESAGFSAEPSAKAGGIGYEKETAPTLRAGKAPAALALENHPTDSRIRISGSDTVQTLTSRMGTGGNNVPLVMETPKALKIRCGREGGGKGALIQDDLSATISCSNDQTLFVPKAYGVCSKTSHSMLSDNPDSGFYEAQSSRTLDGNGGNPSCNQGGIAVVAVEGNGARPSHKGPGFREGESMFTLNTAEVHGVAMEHPAYTTSKSSFHTRASMGFADTLVATDYKDPPCVLKTGSDGCTEWDVDTSNGNKHPALSVKEHSRNNAETDCRKAEAGESRYIVRRLTPTECGRLQGFPDWWCADLGTEEPSEEDIRFWSDVFETHRKVISGAKRPKSEKQIVRWLKDPHTDSAEYRMWGNGVALPCVYFVMTGIVWAAEACRANTIKR